jgi:hypothetical protein
VWLPAQARVRVRVQVQVQVQVQARVRARMPRAARVRVSAAWRGPALLPAAPVWVPGLASGQDPLETTRSAPTRLGSARKP